MKKKCTKCLKEKSLIDFHKESRSKNGYKSKCKECTLKYNNLCLLKNKDKNKKWRQEYYLKNKECILNKRKQYYFENIDKKKKYNIDYRNKNKLAINIKTLEYVNNRIKTDESYRMSRLFRKLFYRLKTEKNGTSAECLGFTADDLKNKLGRIPLRNECIDHKIPVSWFKDLSKIKLINNLENLQILSRSENCKKSNKYSHEISLSYYELIKKEIKTEYITKIKTL